MNRIFTTLIFTVLFHFINNAQTTSLSGVINSYAKVTNIDNSDICNPFLTVDDASVFSAGDYIMIIQMKGAEIDTSNTSNFGSIINLNSAGLYEKAQIDYIDGNDIYLLTLLENNYDVNASVQIVNIPQYVDATVDAPVLTQAWDGEKGGIIAFEVSGTLTMNSKIDASQQGFRGGTREILPVTCNWQSMYDEYFYPDNSFEGSGKGESIVINDYLIGKENGRGANATGGGGGNDHNSGGGGGSNYGAGGIGGMNLDPIPLACLGQFPGIGGYANPSLSNRLFMGGGGGAGHDNNGGGIDGGIGGGIIYVKTNVLEGNWQTFFSNGELLPNTTDFDGAGGGGAGGTIVVDAMFLSSGIGITVRGGNGANVEVYGSNRCMGPGGGGGGGAIFTTISSSPNLITDYLGGDPGVILNSTSNCNGTSNGGATGEIGGLLPFTEIVAAAPIIHMNLISEPEDVIVCDTDIANFIVATDIPADTYQWQIDDGTGYINMLDDTYTSGTQTDTMTTSNLAEGTYLIQCIINGGCGDMFITSPATLEVSSSAMIILDPEDQIICEDEMFVLTAEATGVNVNYQWQVNDGNGFLNVVDDAMYSGATTNELTVQANLDMNGYTFQCEAVNDCPGTATSGMATITVNPLPIPDFSYIISNDTVYVTSASSLTDNYYWDFGDGTPLHPGATPYYVYEESGTYIVTLYAVNDCGTVSMMVPIDINIITGIYSIKEEVNFTLGPNPTTDVVTLDMSAEEFFQAGILLYDNTGKRILNYLTEDNIHVLDMTTLPSGTYILQLVIEGKSSTRKIIKY